MKIEPDGVLVSATFYYTVADVEPITLVYGSQQFNPDRAKIVIVDGSIHGLATEGPRRLKSGANSTELRLSQEYGWSWQRLEIPAWLVELAHTARDRATKAGYVP
jgi:hypothetical protein